MDVSKDVDCHVSLQGFPFHILNSVIVDRVLEVSEKHGL